MFKRSMTAIAALSLTAAALAGPAAAQTTVKTQTTTETTTTGNTGGALTGAAGGAAVGAVVGGPVGAVVGGVAGGMAGAAIDPPQTVRTYVTENRVEPVTVEQEIVVGAALPATVTLHAVPDYEYEYTYVNDQAVLVDASSRQVVYIVD